MGAQFSFPSANNLPTRCQPSEDGSVNINASGSTRRGVTMAYPFLFHHSVTMLKLGSTIAMIIELK